MLKKIIQTIIVLGFLPVLSSCFTYSNLMLVDVPENNVEQYAQIRVIEGHMITISAVDGKELEKEVYKVGVAPGKHEITFFVDGISHAARNGEKGFFNRTITFDLDAQAGRSYFIQYLFCTYTDPETAEMKGYLKVWGDSNDYVSRLGEPRSIQYTEDEKTITGTYTVTMDPAIVLNYINNELLLQQSKYELVSNFFISPEIYRPFAYSICVLHPNYGVARNEKTEYLAIDTGLVSTSGNKPVFSHYIDATIAGYISIWEATPGISTVQLILYKGSRPAHMNFTKYIFERMQY